MGKLTIKKNDKDHNMVELWDDKYFMAISHIDNIFELVNNDQAKRLGEGEELHFRLVEVE